MKLSATIILFVVAVPFARSRIHDATPHADEELQQPDRFLKPEKIEVCQRTFQSLVISENALKTFEKKGALMGACDDNCGVLCDDNNACTVDDQDDCEKSGCTDSSMREEIVCNDDVECTDDSCDPITGCVFTPDDNKCDDTVPCTIDTCDGKECVFTPDDTKCDAEKKCTVDGCVYRCHYSCQSALDLGLTTSGVFDLCPTGDWDKSFTAYCDQETDGGGWMLFVAYKHTAGDTDPLNPLALPPTDPEGFSHVNIGDIEGYTVESIEKLRFYCQTTKHSRKMHFTTEESAIKQMAFAGTGVNSAVSAWTSASTLSDHDAVLPGGTDYTSSNNLFDFPFYVSAKHYWAIRAYGEDNWWFCDGARPYTNTFDTLHNIWVRIAASPQN